MKGYAHAVSGSAAWAAVATPYLHNPQAPWVDKLSLHLIDLTWTPFLIGLLLTAGAALLPDIDHHSGTIAWSLPGFAFIPSPTRGLCKLFEWASGGHRHGTHSFVGIAFFTVLAWLAGQARLPINGTEYAVGSGIFAMLLAAFTFKVFGIGKGPLVRWVGALAAAALVTYYMPDQWEILPAVVLIGCLVHCIGDSLTTGGCPWFWPWIPKPPKSLRNVPILKSIWQPNGWIGVPILGDTDGGTGKNSPKFTRQVVLTWVLTLYIFVTGAVAVLAYSNVLQLG